MKNQQQIEELKKFKQQTFISLYETHKAKIGIYGDFYAVELMGKEEDIVIIEIYDYFGHHHFDSKEAVQIKKFGNAADAIKFYNDNK